VSEDGHTPPAQKFASEFGLNSNPLAPTLSPLGRGEGVNGGVKGVLPKGWSAGCLNPQLVAGASDCGNSCTFVFRAAAAWDKPRSV
jgi:hypothetical protein